MRWTLLALVVLSVAGCGASSDGSHRSSAPRLRDVAAVRARFAAIPQTGRALGSPKAPYTLVEFADMQCPFCAAYDRELLPKVIDRYVRTGRLRLELRLVSFIGPDSATMASAAASAEFQNRVWQFADLVYRNQGRENSGYVTPAYIGAIAGAVPGLDLARFRAASGTPALRRLLTADAQAAHTAAVTATPGFRLGRTGGVLGRPLDRQRLMAALAGTVG